MSESCAPANVIWPPPPNFSKISCTFISPIDLPLIYIISSVFPNTNDALIPLIVNNSSAAFAITIVVFSSSSSYVDIAIDSLTISAFEIIFDMVWYVFKSSWNHFLTFIISTPHLRKYADA